MDTREHLLFMLKTNRQVVKKLIDDITEEESMARGKDRHNHVRWHVGHMLYFNGYTLALLGDQSEDYQGLKGKFAGGTELSDDPSEYPPMADLRERLYSVYDRLADLIGKASEENLVRDINEGGEKEADARSFPVWQQLSWAVMHDFYHAGQLAQARRSLGRERPFG